MLKKRSIRTKLIVALTLLSAIVLLLAFSGFWGLYRYQHLAQSVSQRAKEIRYANEVYRLALSLRESFDRTNQLSGSEGMIDSSQLDPLINLQNYERDRFDQTLESLEVQLQLYENSIAASEEQRLLWVDSASRQRNLGYIRQWLLSFDDFRHSLQPVHLSRKAEFNRRLNELIALTSEHLEMIQEGMDKFSHEVRGQYRAWTTMAWVSTILALSMVGILLWALRSLVVKPFRTLLDGSRLVAGGQFDHRIDLGTGDELSELAQAMNEMTDRFQRALSKLNAICNDLDREVRDRTREVIQNEQLASVGFLAAGVAHEINNPLTTVAWSAESLESQVSELSMRRTDDRVIDDELCDALKTNLRRIEEEAYRCKGITEKLLDFSRLSEVRRASTDLVEIVEEVVEMVGKVGSYRCKTLRTHATGPVFAYVNPQEIRQVILNLVTNALESVDTEGSVDVRVQTDAVNASVTVQDNGCGMSNEVLKHLFEPFFTRRRDGTGTGLGLSITYRIVSQHGGSLIAKSEGEGCGSSMEMLLPLKPEGKDQEEHSRTPLGLNHEPYQTQQH